MIRNNILTVPNGSCISVIPRNPAGDNILDITFANNTGYTNSIGGQFINMGNLGTPGSVTLVNNLWLAPFVLPGEHASRGGLYCRQECRHLKRLVP